MFDIRPVTQTGVVDFAKLASVTPLLNLRPAEVKVISAPLSIRPAPVAESEVILAKAETPATLAVADFQRELQEELAREQDYDLVLASVGGKLHLPLRKVARRRTDIPLTLEKTKPDTKTTPVPVNQLSLRPDSVISSRSVVARVSASRLVPTRNAVARFAYTPAAR